jgi:hypothetical protein
VYIKKGFFLKVKKETKSVIRIQAIWKRERLLFQWYFLLLFLFQLLFYFCYRKVRCLQWTFWDGEVTTKINHKTIKKKQKQKKKKRTEFNRKEERRKKKVKKGK